MNKAIISGRVAGVLAAVSAIALLGLIVLYAYAPELRARHSIGADAVSRSAVGFAGLKELLDLSGIPAEIDRGATTSGGAKPSLTILTPTIANNAGDILGAIRGPVLLILPKWTTAPVLDNRDWVMKTGAYDIRLIERQIIPVIGTVTLVRSRRSDRQILATVKDEKFSAIGPHIFGHVEEMQTLLGASPILTAPAYGQILSQARRKGDPIYILSDPDLMNNHGLADRETARAAVAMINALRQGNGPVALDVTLDGLGRSRSLLRALFEAPFAGATLCAIIAAFLMGLHSAVRFGPPLREKRFFALGKIALADNTADLVRMMGREGAMAPGYVAASRNLALERLGARGASAPQQDALLESLERGSDATPPYAELTREAATAANSGDLLRIAQKTYAWRRRITREA